MTDKNLTEVICVVDRSGSMWSIQEDAIGGFNKFLKDQQELDVDKCNLTYVQFDTEYEMVHECTPVKDVPLLTKETYEPRGCTALLDAVGRTIYDVSKRHLTLDEDKLPGAVVVLIITDGQENSSSSYNRSKVKEMIEHQTKTHDWQFVFLGADQDAFVEAGALGISAAHTANFSKDAIGTAYNVVSSTVSTYRSTKDITSLTMDDNISD